MLWCQFFSTVIFGATLIEGLCVYVCLNECVWNFFCIYKEADGTLWYGMGDGMGMKNWRNLLMTSTTFSLPQSGLENQLPFWMGSLIYGKTETDLCFKLTHSHLYLHQSSHSVKWQESSQLRSSHQNSTFEEHKLLTSF